MARWYHKPTYLFQNMERRLKKGAGITYWVWSLDCRSEDWGSTASKRRRFSFLHTVQVHPASYPIGYCGGPISLGISGPGAKLITHSVSVKVKNMWSCTSSPPYVLMVCSLIKFTDNFIFTCYSPVQYIGKTLNKQLYWENLNERPLGS